MREKKADRKVRALKIIDTLKASIPKLESELDYRNPLQCLIATILSAQCTDVRVNLVTPVLFDRYTTATDFAEADQEELETLIRSTGFFRNKATNIIKCCKAIVDHYGGNVPDTLDELITLDGVGRKTANCVVGNAYDKPAVMVDTHVKRLMWRMWLTTNKNPDKIEFDIRALLPEELWLPGCHALILHGRRVCKSRKPSCSICVINELCPKRDVKTSQ